MQPVPHASRTARSKPGLYNAELGYCNKELYEYELFFAGGDRSSMFVVYLCASYELAGPVPEPRREGVILALGRYQAVVEAVRVGRGL